MVSVLKHLPNCGGFKSCEECPYNDEVDCIHKANADFLISKNFFAMPCKIGGVLWCVRRRTERNGNGKRIITIAKTKLTNNNFVDVMKDYGTKYFRTRAEAEKACGVKHITEMDSSRKKPHLCNKCCADKKECSWRSSLEPVKGWKAKKINFKYGQKTVKAYKVISCPLFKENKESSERLRS